MRLTRRSAVAALAGAGAAMTLAPAGAQDGSLFPITGEDGKPVVNYKVPVELESRIEEMPGVVVIGNKKGDVTLAEFYDLNCPFCRKAAADAGMLVATDKELRLVLVPFPVLGVPSIQAGRIELAVAKLGTPEQFLAFHRRVFSVRGTIDGARALAVVKELGMSVPAITKAADDDATTDTMLAHVRLGNSLGLQATPSWVIKGVAVLGHPGRKALEQMVASVRRCDQVSC
ncbi:DsbA family protein [Rhodoplanes sp. SY1]|uniref:DsbA family protein n=1 Tax=Rhodoplanes sp. SY1 TaxID=3166646 RepID=UPI0038B654FE